MVASIFEFLNQEPHSRLGKPVALKLKAACKGVKREKKSPCPSKKQVNNQIQTGKVHALLYRHFFLSIIHRF
jgi:hypothetical protein